MLTRVVNVVFHCAATVRFDEELTKSVTMNVGAVAAIIKLARRMEKLEVRQSFATHHELQSLRQYLILPHQN